jgi:ribosomal protein S17E
MFASLFNKAKGWAQKLGLNKHVSNFSNMFNKAKHVVNNTMDILRSSPIKSLVNKVSEYIPSAGSYYNDAKKYGGIVSNLMSGGLEEKPKRFIKHPPSIERNQKPDYGDDQFTGASSLFQ